MTVGHVGEDHSSSIPATDCPRCNMTDPNIIESDELDVADKFPDLTTQESEPAEMENPIDRALAVLGLDLAGAERAITERIVDLPAPLVPGALYDIEAMFRTLQRIRAVVEAKAAAVWDEAVPLGAAWVGPDGVAYEFASVNKRTVKDPTGLKDALMIVYRERHTNAATAIAERNQVMSGFRFKEEVLMTPINELAALDPRYKEARDEWVTWQSGPKHLKPIEQTYKKR